MIRPSKKYDKFNLHASWQGGLQTIDGFRFRPPVVLSSAVEFLKKCCHRVQRFGTNDDPVRTQCFGFIDVLLDKTPHWGNSALGEKSGHAIGILGSWQVCVMHPFCRQNGSI
jgi:hypothetical protein